MARIRMGSRQLTPAKTERARRMRKEAGASEAVFWELIRQGKTGFKFRRQHVIGPYTLDFYCAEAKLCVEVDGELHAQRKDRDSVRDEFMRDLGIETVRVPSLDLFSPTHIKATKWVTEIVALCESRAGRKAWDR